MAAMLRNQIMAGKLAPGSQLPPLRELESTLGVARMTVKQAMDALAEEGLIERQAGRGTFVKEIVIPQRQTLNMKAELSQLHAMVAQLEVAVLVGDSQDEEITEDGTRYQCMKRVHALDGKAFCRVELRLDSTIYERECDRFDSEIVVSVLNDIGIPVESARQRVRIAYADFETARALDIKLNSPVFQVFREFFDSDDRLIYSATLVYPGDMLEFDIEFTVEAES